MDAQVSQVGAVDIAVTKAYCVPRTFCYCLPELNINLFLRSTSAVALILILVSSGFGSFIDMITLLSEFQLSGVKQTSFFDAITRDFFLSKDEDG